MASAIMPYPLLRYVGVIWFLFHVLRFLPIGFTLQIMCCISESMMEHMQKLV